MKDARTIPALIYHVEKYEQMLYALEQKTKASFTSFLPSYLNGIMISYYDNCRFMKIQSHYAYN